MSDTTAEITRKIGQNRGKRRLWIEGVSLASFGWKKGTRFNARFEKGSIVYERDDNGKRKVAGDETRPIIDTNTDKIGDSLGSDAEQVKVTITASKITVKLAALALALASLFFNVLPAHAQRVLVACEFSGIVRDEFRALGHDAISCDLLDTERPGDHIRGDVLEVLNRDCWDMVLTFPPCTYLCSSGLWRCNPKHDPDGTRTAHKTAALDFVREFMNCKAPRVAIENPVGAISTEIRKPDQIIQPYEYGHPESKKTCLWLKGLDPLQPTNILNIEQHGREVEPGKFVWQNQTKSGQNNLSPGKDRWKQRSRTYAGIARAMARQWGSILAGVDPEPIPTPAPEHKGQFLFNFAA